MSQNFSPGWNDPPSLSYQHTGSKSNVRNLLNRRIAFPVNAGAGGSDNNITTQLNNPYVNYEHSVAQNGGVPNTFDPSGHLAAATAAAHFNRSVSTPAFSPTCDVSPQISALPVAPVFPSTPVARPPPVASVEVQGSDRRLYSNEEIVSILQGAATGCTNMPKAMRDNVDRRIQTLKSRLDSNSLSEACRSKLCALVEDLSKYRFNDAYNIHSVMMIEHFNEVNAWMVGIKAVIMEYQKK